MFLNVRKERVHQWGHSNIDFRSNNSESISKFVNAKNKIDFISANKNYFNSDENNNSDFLKSPNPNKKIILKLPFNNKRKIKKISEAIKNSNDANIEKAIYPNVLEQNNNFFKIISPIRTTGIRKTYISEGENAFDLNGKVDSVIKDIRDNYGVDNEFIKNNVTAKSEKALARSLRKGIESSENETPSKINFCFFVYCYYLINLFFIWKFY
jgi:hypothetical protein